MELLGPRVCSRYAAFARGTQEKERVRVKSRWYYLLNLQHRDGCSKAAFFESFGFSSAEPQRLSAALLDHPIRNEVSEVSSSPFGAKYLVKCGIETPDGRNPCVATVWIIENDSGPRLVTAFPA